MCEILYTIPSARGQGVATKLLEWGIDKAKELDLKDVYAEAYKGGEVFFERLGFEKRGEVELRVDENEFAEGEREEVKSWKGELEWEGVRVWKRVG